MEQPHNSSSSHDWPPFMVLIILVVAALFGGLLGSGLAYVISTMQGQDLVSLLSSLQGGGEIDLETRNSLRLLNMVSHFFAFTFPVVLITLLLYRRGWLKFLRLDRSPALKPILAACFFMLAVFPVAQFTYWLNQQIPLPEWAGALENNAAAMLEGLMNMESIWELFFNLFVMAVLPAVGEELMFRGVVQQKLRQQTKNAHLAIWITAIIFSAIHMQFEGFLARLTLGAALGYLFYWTKNLWIPIIAHFLVNGLQIAMQYFFEAKMDEITEKAEDLSNVPWASAAVGLVLIYVFGRYLQSLSLR